MLSEGVNKGRTSLAKLVEIACANPAKAFGIYPRKGAIRVGSDADLVIVDLQKEMTVRADKLHHISDFTPYEGWKIKGWPVLTMVRGNVIMEKGGIVGQAGYGTYIPGQMA